MSSNSNISKQFLWVMIVIAITSTLVGFIYFTRKDVAKEVKEQKPPLVQTITATPVDFKASLEAFGTVQANREVAVRPEVSGRIVEQSSHLILGGILKKGELLVRIDPKDYEILVEQEKAALEKAEFDLQVERGRQVVAKREWEQLNPSFPKSELSEELALRKPHLREKQAALEAAKSRLEKAMLDLKRTSVISPMNAVVLGETTEPGDYINPQTTIANLAATDEFRVQVSVPIGKISWVDFPDEMNGKGSKALIHIELGSGDQISYEGYVQRLLGNLDPSGRMARVVITVEDPLGLEEPERQRHPLLIGTYVRVEIEGPVLEDVYVLPRKALRENGRVWIVSSKSTLEFREVKVISGNTEEVVVQQGLDPGDEVITSHISLPLPGMKVRIETAVQGE